MPNPEGDRQSHEYQKEGISLERGKLRNTTDKPHGSD